MKKVISVLLALLLVASMLSVAAFAESGSDLKIAVASDLHYCRTPEAIEGPSVGSIDDPIYWYANRRAAMETESGFIIDEFLKQCADSDCDYVLISGDLADSGRRYPEEHYDVAEKLRKFEAETGKDVFVIDGNHDLGEDTMTDVDDFKKIYADFGYDKALETLDGTCSYTANLGEKYRLIALDSCDPTASTADGMNAERVDWVITQAKLAKNDGRYPILMMHHNLLDHMPLQRVFSKNFIVKFHYSTAELFADAGIKIVISGHEHCSDATSYTSGLGNTIYDFATTSLTMYPTAYRVFEFSDSEISYTAKTIESIDTAALTGAVSGYSDEQIALMNAGLNSYAKGFLKAGVQYRLERSLSMEKLGVSEDAPYYELVKNAVDTLLLLLNKPLYGEGSVSEIASGYNIEIPSTPYKTGWDLATDLVAAHYAGEEPFSPDRPEVTAFLRTAAVILRELMPKVGAEVYYDAANALLAADGTSDLSSAIVSDFSGADGITPAEYFIYSLASPIIYGFAYDDDGVNDNNGVLSGYGESENNELSNGLDGTLGEILKKLQYIVHYLLRIFDVILK